MTNISSDCILCQGQAADANLERTQVWTNDYWRLTRPAEVPGFSYLEPNMQVRLAGFER